MVRFKVIFNYLNNSLKRKGLSFINHYFGKAGGIFGFEPTILENSS